MSYRAQVPDVATLILNGGSPNPLMVTNVGNNTVYVSENGAVTAPSDQQVDVGGSLVVNPKSQLWAVCQSGLASSLAVTTNVGQRFAYASASSRPISTTNWTQSYGPTNGYPTSILTYDTTLATQFGSIQIVLSRTDRNSGITNPNTYIVTYTDFVAPLPVNQYGTYGANAVSGNQQQVMITTAGYPTNENRPIFSVTFPTRGYGGTYSIRPLTDTVSGLTVEVLGQAQTITAPKVWVNPIALEAVSNGQWTQDGNLYSRLDTATYSGGFSSPNYYDFLLPPTNGATQLSVTYTVSGGGAPASSWQLYSYVGYQSSFIETFGKVATSNVLSTDTTTGAGKTFTVNLAFIPRNPTYLRYGLGGTASMTSCQITIGGELT